MVKMYSISSISRTNKSTTIFTLLLHLALFFTWIASPVLSIVPIFLYLFFFSQSKTVQIFYFFLLATVPALINTTKTPVSDLLEYYLLYKSLYFTHVSQFFDEIQRDQFFYFVSMILSKGSNATNQVFIFFWTTLTYFFTFLSLSIFATYLENYNKKVLVGIVFFTLLVGITFTISGHIVRQYAAAAFLLLGIVLLINKNKTSFFLIFSAFFSHWSTFLYAGAFMLDRFKITHTNKVILIIVISTFIIGSSNILNLLTPYLTVLQMGNSNEMSIMAERAINYADYVGDGSLGFRQLLLLIVSSIIALYLYIVVSNEKVKHMLFFIIFTLSIIMLVRNNPLLFLRYAMFLEFFFSFLLLIVLTKYWHIQYVRLFFYTGLFIAPIKFIRSLQGSNWTFVSNDYTILFNTVFDMYNYLN